MMGAILNLFVGPLLAMITKMIQDIASFWINAFPKV